MVSKSKFLIEYSQANYQYIYFKLYLNNFFINYQVSRTFGDLEAKLPKYGGNPNVVIAEPEISVTKIKDNFDFIILASKMTF